MRSFALFLWSSCLQFDPQNIQSLRYTGAQVKGEKTADCLQRCRELSRVNTRIGNVYAVAILSFLSAVLIYSGWQEIEVNYDVEKVL